MRAFYRKVLVEGDGLGAMAAMNNAVDPDSETFRIFNCQQLFCNVWDWYLEESSKEEWITHRIDEALPTFKAKRPRSANEIEGFPA